MITLVLENEPAAATVAFSHNSLIITLTDGRSLTVPLQWYPRLLYASTKERNNWQLLGNGYAIEWPDIDEHIGVEGLLAGRRSGESQKSLERWMSSRNSHSIDQ